MNEALRNLNKRIYEHKRELKLNNSLNLRDRNFEMENVVLVKNACNFLRCRCTENDIIKNKS